MICWDIQHIHTKVTDKADLCHPEWQLEYLENGMR